MHRSHPNLRSEASPKMCALECQKTFLPSGSSNGRSSSLQLFSRGRSRSHRVSSGVPLSRRATTVRSNRLLEMFRAMSAGLVTHDSPSMFLPSSSVMVIFSVTRANESVLCKGVPFRSNERTAGLLGDLFVVLCLQFFTETMVSMQLANLQVLYLQNLNAMVDECRCRVEHQWATITSIALGLLLLLWLRGLVSFLPGLLLSRHSHVLHSLDSRVDSIFDCVRHVVVVAVEPEACWVGVYM
jgi:hypothetical protein